VNAPELLAEEFEQHRGHLQGVAYRMLGSLTDADDIVQEAWLRLSRSDSSSVENMRGWLTTVVARLCLDALRSRQARREDGFGPGLPEPVVAPENGSDPEHEALLADSVGLALLVVLDTLSPPERLAFVLHDMFALPFDEIAPIVGRSPAATRKLASRARRRVQGSLPRSDADSREQRRVVDAFLAATRAGDFRALLELLDPGVVLRLDRGALPVADHQPAVVGGATEVARVVVTRGRGFAPYCLAATVNGMPGLVVAPGGRVVGAVGFTVAGGRITEIDVVADREKVPALDM
jgi:RNA polymerase sigma factor (sigma-70 family)